MATTQITEAAFQTACAECADAIAAGDYVTARTKAAVAEAINSGLLARLTVGSVDKTRREALTGLWNAIGLVSAGATANDDRRMINTRMGYDRQ